MDLLERLKRNPLISILTLFTVVIPMSVGVATWFFEREKNFIIAKYEAKIAKFENEIDRIKNIKYFKLMEKFEESQKDDADVNSEENNDFWPVSSPETRSTIDNYAKQEVNSLIKEEDFFDTSVRAAYKEGLIKQLGINKGKGILISDDGKRYIQFRVILNKNGKIWKTIATMFSRDFLISLNKYQITEKELLDIIHQFNTFGEASIKLSEGTLRLGYDYSDSQWVTTRSISYDKN